MKDKIQLLHFNAFNPRKNLPRHIGGKQGENRFASAFERAFIKSQISGLGGKQFALDGYGIADFIWLATQDNSLPVFYAFEVKLSDWKKALQQAFRYSCYSDKSIVVLPKEIKRRVQPHVTTFINLNVGLWLFEKKTCSIDPIYTPEDRSANWTKAREKAFKMLSRQPKFRHFAELINAFSQRLQMVAI
jgi:hypothetical protein